MWQCSPLSSRLSESARERRTALYKSDQQLLLHKSRVHGVSRVHDAFEPWTHKVCGDGIFYAPCHNNNNGYFLQSGTLFAKNKQNSSNNNNNKISAVVHTIRTHNCIYTLTHTDSIATWMVCLALWKGLSKEERVEVGVKSLNEDISQTSRQQNSRQMERRNGTNAYKKISNYVSEFVKSLSLEDRRARAVWYVQSEAER